MIWFIFTLLTVVLWASTSLLYKAGIHKEKEEYTCLKYSVSIGVIFFVIAVAYLIVRHEPFSIWESAIRFWPVTVFAFVYPILNTISFKGYIYNEVSVESPVESIGSGSSVILLIMVYLALGRVDSVSQLLTGLRTAGIVVILISIILLSIVRNREFRQNQQADPGSSNSSWKWRGLGTLIFPVIFAMADAMETVVTGICLDTTYGYNMPEGDCLIIIGMVYSAFGLCFWIYTYIKEKKLYNPFCKKDSPRILGAVTDNIGIVFYSYAMAINSVSTDPVLAVYPVLVMVGGRVLMKEELSTDQYILLLGIIAGSVLVVADTI